MDAGQGFDVINKVTTTTATIRQNCRAQAGGHAMLASRFILF